MVSDPSIMRWPTDSGSFRFSTLLTPLTLMDPTCAGRLNSLMLSSLKVSRLSKGRVDRSLVRTFADTKLAVFPHESSYVEAQIWSALDLSDVQEFLSPADAPPEVLARLKSAGVPVYSYKEVANPS